MDTAAWLVLSVLVLVLLSVSVRSRDPEVRRRYDRWGTGHGRYSSRTTGWFGADGG